MVGAVATDAMLSLQVELCVVIGKAGRDIPVKSAMDYVAGSVSQTTNGRNGGGPGITAPPFGY